MPNTILDLKNPGGWIAKESLRILSNNLVAVGKMNKDVQEEFTKNPNGYKVGATVNVRKPARFTIRQGRVATPQDFNETYVPVTVDKQRGVDVAFTSAEMTLNLDKFSERVLEPQLIQLANFVDAETLAGVYSEVFNSVGTPGQTPNSFKAIANGVRRLNEEAAPAGIAITGLLDPAAQTEMADALKGTFQKKTVDDALLKGYLTTLSNADLYLSQGLPYHQVGPLGGTPAVNGAGQTGATLVTNGWTAAAAARLKKGDVFTIPGVFAVNPLTRQTTGVLRNFVVTADVSSDGSGNASIPIYPAIVTTGALQTVTASPANGAQLSIITGAANTAYVQNLLYQTDAFAFASVPLEMPKNMDMSGRESANGLSVRFVRGYDITQDQFISRIDVLYGFKTVFPELAVRIPG